MTGEYNCKIDSKGRIRLPSKLIRQLGEGNKVFTINRGFEQHLIMYPREVWEQKTEEMNQLSLYRTDERKVVRFFYRGASEVEMDGADRILLPKGLMKFAQIQDEVVLFAYRDQIEIWSKEGYEAMINEEPENFATLADKVFGVDRTDL